MKVSTEKRTYYRVGGRFCSKQAYLLDKFTRLSSLYKKLNALVITDISDSLLETCLTAIAKLFDYLVKLSTELNVKTSDELGVLL